MSFIFRLIIAITIFRFIWTRLIRPLLQTAATSNNYNNTNRGNLHYLSMLMPLVARIAKADGRISESEIATIENIFRELNLTPDELHFAKQCFIETKNQPDTFDEALFRFTRSGYSFEFRWLTFRWLIRVAMAENGRIDSTKRQLLMIAGRAFGIPRMLLDQILGPTASYHHTNTHTRPTPNQQRRQDLSQFGLSENATNEEIKRAYRQKVKELHPDRLHAQGLPEAMIKQANDRMAEINAAYERLVEK